ncbi:extradiol ring-cleavage dioxygenase [Knoellia sinensis KCTC 19936]|uniref:Extradiol ring-cleavage dioxygenase n=1 Tax=Knoellia sinensis KCTC 19936 TaxID=1385520 RepID=A0A0A0JBU4_9MICO|nr:class III extradiol ring-cleavage dioxygenase [Knoellia sinensis]KGN34284.1 extradiol ring-cleavage dioxygenase [Knoellia sinensis KCTC 19936]
MTNPAHLASQHRPAGAYEDLHARVVDQARAQRVWTPDDGAMPALFVSHGAPPTLDDPEWLADLFTWSQSMPKPRAVVIVSAHWENAPVAISGAAAGTPLVYDFGGFHPKYYTLQYGTPDASDLARRLAGVLGGITPIHHHVNRGLDHGAFIPMMAMYPAADVPVVQLSMPSLEPAALLRLGQKLRSLREEGILVIGSGFMTHSFAVMRDPSLAGHTAAFDEWAADALERGDVDALTDYLAKGPGAAVSHPTADHFVPLLLTMGAATDAGRPQVKTAIEKVRFHNSIRSIQVA